MLLASGTPILAALTRSLLKDDTRSIRVKGEGGDDTDRIELACAVQNTSPLALNEHAPSS